MTKRIVLFACVLTAGLVLTSCLPPDDWNWNRPEGYTGSGPSVLVHGTVFGLDDAALAGVRVCDASQCVNTDAAGNYTLELAARHRADVRIWKVGYPANRYVLNLRSTDFYVSHHLLTQKQYEAAVAVAGGQAVKEQGLLSIAFKDYGGVPDLSQPGWLHATAASVAGLALAVTPAPLGSILLDLPYTEGSYTIYMAAIKTGSHSVTLTLPAGTKCGNVNGAEHYRNGKFTVDVKAQYINRVVLWCTH